MRRDLTIIACQVMSLILMLAAPAFAGWSQPIRISEPGQFADPRISARGDTIHVVYEDLNVTDKISYQRSTDAGLTWSPHQVLSDDSAGTLFPKIIASGSRLMILWKNHFYWGSPNHNNIGYSVSTNNGRTWTLPRYVLNPGWQHILYFAASGHDLAVNIVLNSRVGDSLVFYSIRSTNFGQTWTVPQEMFRTYQAGLPDQAGVDNFVHFVWDGRFDLQHHVDIYYTCSVDSGINWTSNIPLSSTDQFHSQLPSIGINGAGKLDVIWMDYKYSPYIGTGDILLRESADSGSTWGPERQATFDHYAWTSDVVSNGDTIHIAWNDEGTGLGHRSIYYTRSTDNGATWSDPYWLDGTLDDSADPALAIANGRIHAVWTDSRPNPDTSVCCGLYISRWTPDPDAIHNGDAEKIPENIRLSAYPNPFNSSVTITYFNLSYGFEGKGGDIRIYDIQGKMVKTLKTEGGMNGKIIWDATDASGEKVSSGIYFARAHNGSEGTGASPNSIELKLLYVK